jgi:DNA-binding CsgD family transcriptional regulator
MPRLDEATTAAMSGEMTDPVAIGLSCCYLVTACERIRDFARAAQWCQHVKEFCERIGFGFLLSVCRTQYAAVLTWRGRWTEAEQELQAVTLHLAATRPAVKQEAVVRLADLRRQQGRLDEAALLLKQVDGGHPLATLAHASLALDRSDPASAARQAQRFLRQLPALNRTDRVAALDVLLRAQLALDQRNESRATLDELRAIAAMVGTEPMKASALIGDGLAAAHDGDHPRARRALEDASDLLARSGASLELARCRVELGRVLEAVGERDGARAELEEALRMFEALGAGQYAATTSALLGARGGASRVPAPARERGAITRREIEVLRLVAQGLSNQQIAKRLVRSEFTVKRHVANLLAKLDLPSRAAAAAYAARQGLT